MHMAADSVMIHICICIFTINHFLDSQKPSEPCCTYYWMALKMCLTSDEEFVLGCWTVIMEGQIHEETCSCNSSCCWTSSVKVKLLNIFGRTSPIMRSIQALLVPSQRIFSFRLQTFYHNLRAPCRWEDENGHHLLDRWSMPFIPSSLIPFLSFFLSQEVLSQ